MGRRAGNTKTSLPDSSHLMGRFGGGRLGLRWPATGLYLSPTMVRTLCGASPTLHVRESALPIAGKFERGRLACPPAVDSLAIGNLQSGGGRMRRGIVFLTLLA